MTGGAAKRRQLSFSALKRRVNSSFRRETKSQDVSEDVKVDFSFENNSYNHFGPFFRHPLEQPPERSQLWVTKYGIAPPHFNWELGV